ncbi:cysteine--tRNA ligase [Candidatus Shapirobacteria bacterium]|nr:cysteine--tRNA ligase [Candidatus Shapirobacteria bacterium]
MTKIKLYNTLTRKKEVFKPLEKGKVKLYDCGPTVYWYAHIGNMWRYLVSDFLRRILEYNDYQVKQVVNITDVGHLTEDDLLAADTGEDKMVLAAKKEKKTPAQIANFYTRAYFKDRRALNILDPRETPKATDYIKGMIELTRKLEDKGYAYRLADRVCFDVAKFKDYGKLSGKKLDELKIGARLEPVQGKKNPYDFSLWIINDKHLMKWDSPWGAGYPGWHIECSVMSSQLLGDQIDIHTGGEDNIFPHHENEIAQSEAASGKQFVRYWLHVRHNFVNGKKMSKSRGGLYLLKDLTDKGFHPLSYRYLSLSNHYRHNLNFTWESLGAAQKAWQKLQLLVSDWKEVKSEKRDFKKERTYQDDFLKAINNDLGMPQALVVLWRVVKDQQLAEKSKLALVLDFDRVLGLQLGQKKVEIPKKVIALAKKREELRKKNNFKQADEVRKQIERLGFIVKDETGGYKIEPAG